MKKKLCSLGALAIISTPIMAVVSCSNDTRPTDEELETYRDLTSPEAIRILENQWQYLVLGWTKGEKLNQNFKNIEDVELTDEIKQTAQDIININIQEDEEYLRKMGKLLLDSNANRFYSEEAGEKDNNNAYSDAWLSEHGLLATYQFGTVTFGENGDINDEALRLLVSDDRIEFKQTLLKTLVVEKYLGTTRDEWAAVYPYQDSNLSQIEKMIDPSLFVLVKEMLANKYFAKWELSLDERETAKVVGITDPEKSFEASYNALKKDGVFGTNASYTEREAKSNQTIFDFNFLSDVNLGYDLIGFQGFSKPESSSKLGVLDFSKKSYQKANNYDDWTGFITLDSKKFVTADTYQIEDDSSSPLETVTWVGEKADPKEAKLTFVKGIMPIYTDISETDEANEKLTVKYIPPEGSTQSATYIATQTKLQIEEITKFIALQNLDLYSEAMDFYLTRVVDKDYSDGKDTSKEPIYLKILDDDYATILKDEFNVKFIEEKEVEDEE